MKRLDSYMEGAKNMGYRATLALALTGCGATVQKPVDTAPSADKTNTVEIWADDIYKKPIKCEPIEWQVGKSPTWPILYRTERGMHLSATIGEWSTLRWKIADVDGSGNYTALCPQPGLEGRAMEDFIRITEDNRVVLKAAVNGGKQHRDEAFRSYRDGEYVQTYLHEARDKAPSWSFSHSRSGLKSTHSFKGLHSESSHE